MITTLGVRQVTGQILRIFRRGHYIMIPAQGQGGNIDLSDLVHNVESIAGLHIIERCSRSVFR